MAGKRTVSVTIRMSPEDLQTLTRAAMKRWPKAILSRAAIVLSLAKIGAEKTKK